MQVQARSSRCFGLSLHIVILAIAISALASAARAAEFRLMRHQVVDTEGFGYPALDVLLPAGWTCSGQVIWQQNVAGPDARIRFEAVDPTSGAVIELFPAVIGFQSQDPGLNQAHAMYGLNVAPMPDVAAFVEQVFIPGVRAHVSGIEMLGMRDFPELGAAERMPDLAPSFAVVATSLQRSARWDVDCTRLVATIARSNLQTQQQIFSAMQGIASRQQSIGDEMMASWQERERTRDRVFDRWSEANRGVTSWDDPVGGSVVESPGHYRHGWSSGGEYIFTDDALFNPNIGSQRNWTAMSVR